MTAPSRRLRIGVMGAGSVGCYVGGRLVAAHAADVVFVGRRRVQTELVTHGLTVKAFDRPGQTVQSQQIRFETEPTALSTCDVVLCCVKSAQTPAVASQLAAVLAPGCVVVSLQNGMRNGDVLRKQLDEAVVVAGIVGFNVVSSGSGLFHQAMSGSLIIEANDDPNARALTSALRCAGLDVQLRADIAPDQWTKLLVNLNNSVSALSGAPTRDLLLRPLFRKVVAAVIEEALAVLRAADIKPAKLRGVPVGWMPKVLRMPTPIVRVVTRAQMRVDPQARSSMWEDLNRRRTTEIAYLNGEIVSLAEALGRRAPRNLRLVELVGAAERAAAGSPGLSAEQLWAEIRSAR